ncbi:MAG: hypothetical protein A07HN63_02374 [uncultured archaeon A07HN63]|nr:MAG: hypothetical protein A07HN63_02374 [uncultured archaeon A07HN63]
MSPNRSLALAVATGLAIGGIVYQFLLTDWFFVQGVTTTYVGLTYFYLAFDVPLLGGQHLQYTDRRDRFGYAIGLFGLSTGSLALTHYAQFSQSETFGVLVWTAGVIAFLLFASIAKDQQPRAV